MRFFVRFYGPTLAIAVITFCLGRYLGKIGNPSTPDARAALINPREVVLGTARGHRADDPLLFKKGISPKDPLLVMRQTNGVVIRCEVPSVRTAAYGEACSVEDAARSYPDILIPGLADPGLKNLVLRRQEQTIEPGRPRMIRWCVIDGNVAGCAWEEESGNPVQYALEVWRDRYIRESFQIPEGFRILTSIFPPCGMNSESFLVPSTSPDYQSRPASKNPE